MTDDILFHYTTPIGLLGIAKTGELWATKIQFLNDSSEFALAFDDARIVLNQRKRDRTFSNRHDFIDYAIELISRLSQRNVFVVSFSEAGNLLSQWRAYGRGAISYSIGFNRANLERLGSRSGFNLHKCIYNPSERTELVSKIVESALSALAEDEKKVGFDYHASREIHGQRIAGEIALWSPLFKHHSFSEEREWRLISFSVPIGDPRVFSRIGKLGLIPTCRVDLKDDSGKMKVKELFQGPAPDVEHALQGLTCFRFNHDNFMEIEAIKPSYTPFRET